MEIDFVGNDRDIHRGGAFGFALALVDRGPLPAQAIASSAAGPSAAPAPLPFSIGQPPHWHHALTAPGTAFTREARAGATLGYGVFHAFSKPPQLVQLQHGLRRLRAAMRIMHEDFDASIQQLPRAAFRTG